MTDTPKDIHLSIWELLTPHERPQGFIEPTWDHEYFRAQEGWKIVGLPDTIAHRCIVDAAREVLERNQYQIHYKQRWEDEEAHWWFSCAYGPMKRDYPTRTECVYHALKWLREQEDAQ